MGKWSVARADSDFERYLEDLPNSTVDLFWRFIKMARSCGATQFELQTDHPVLRGSRRIFASVRPTPKELTGHLNLPYPIVDARIRRSDRLTTRLLMHGFAISAASDLDARFQSWLRDAVAVGDGDYSIRQH